MKLPPKSGHQPLFQVVRGQLLSRGMTLKRARSEFLSISDLKKCILLEIFIYVSLNNGDGIFQQCYPQLITSTILLFNIILERTIKVFIITCL